MLKKTFLDGNNPLKPPNYKHKYKQDRVVPRLFFKHPINNRMVNNNKNIRKHFQSIELPIYKDEIQSSNLIPNSIA